MKALLGASAMLLALTLFAACQDSVTGLGDRTDGIASLADKPGPGDTQCIPGQNGPPQGGKKAGACSNQ